MTSTARRVRRLFESLPEVEVTVGGERDQHLGAAVRKKRFAWFLDDHHGDGAVALTCRAPAGVNTSTVEEDPERYFIPSYTGPKGWLGIRLDVGDIDWDRVELLVGDAYRMTAPTSLLAQLGDD